MHIIFFILLVFLFFFIFAVSIVGNFIRSILGIGKRFGKGERQTSEDGRQQRHSSYQSQEDKQHKKIFSPDEGEYTDFEEIK